MADQPRMQPEKPLKIKPPLSSPAEQEVAAALRAQLKIELQNKKQCANPSYECTLLSIDGYKYCLKHIIQDKSAPYRQCTYVYTNNGKRCNLAAPRGDKKDPGLCNEHALKTTLARNRQSAKNPPPKTAEVVLNTLSHYVKQKSYRTALSSTQHAEEERMSPEDGELKVTKCLDPWTEIDASNVYNAACNEVLDVCSESESDVEASTYSNVWHDAQADSSDNESIDSEQEDVLKHANVYTAEEITLVTRDKLIRLQSLYIEQYRHLQYLLREKRRKYLQSLKREKETCCNIYNQIRDNPKEQRLYKKLKDLNKYQKHFGTEAILNKKLHDLRAKAQDGTLHRPTNFSKCSFSEEGVKCQEKVLPLAKHCRKHILLDQSQVLFKACGTVSSDIECQTPIEAIFEDSKCKLHMKIPVLRSYSTVRKDSESDMEDSIDNSKTFSQSIPSTSMVKPELLDYKLPEIPKMETVPSQLFEDSVDEDGFKDEMDITMADDFPEDLSMLNTDENLASSSQEIANLIQNEENLGDNQELANLIQEDTNQEAPGMLQSDSNSCDTQDFPSLSKYDESTSNESSMEKHEVPPKLEAMDIQEDTTESTDLAIEEESIESLDEEKKKKEVSASKKTES